VFCRILRERRVEDSSQFAERVIILVPAAEFFEAEKRLNKTVVSASNILESRRQTPGCVYSSPQQDGHRAASGTAVPKAGIGEVSPLSQSPAVFLSRDLPVFPGLKLPSGTSLSQSKKAREKRMVKAQASTKGSEMQVGIKPQTTLDRSGWRRHRSMLDDLVAQKSGVGAGAMLSRSGTIVELWWGIEWWRLSADPGAVFA
jgi:hypothetical protein